MQPADFDLDTLETLPPDLLRCRHLRLPTADPLAPVAAGVVDNLRDNPAFSALLDRVAQLTGGTSPDRDRVQLSYTSRLSPDATTLPCAIKVLSDLGCTDPLPPVYERQFHTVDASTFNDLMGATRPNLRIEIDMLSVNFTPQTLDDFTPSGIAKQVAPLHELQTRRGSLHSLIKMAHAHPDAEPRLSQIQNDPELVNAIVNSDWARRHDADHADQSAAIQDLRAQLDRDFHINTDHDARALRHGVHDLCIAIVQNDTPVAGTLAETAAALIRQTDVTLAAQITEILHHPDYLRLESVWRGLWYLVDACATNHRAQIQVMNLSKDALYREIRRYPGLKFAQSPIHKWLVDQTFGTLGGLPTTCIVTDYYFDHSVPDVRLLTSLSRITAAAQAVVIAGANPNLFMMDSWAELPQPKELHQMFKYSEYEHWRALRDDPNAQFIALTAPRFAARAAFGTDNPDAHITLDATLGQNWADQICWANAAYVVVSDVSAYGTK